MFNTKQQLLDYMKQQDPELYKQYINAPAASKHHSAYKGGLLKHSTNVYNRLLEWKMKHPTDTTLTEEDIIIVAFLHDLCKAITYKRNMDGTYKADKDLYIHHATLSIQLIEAKLNIILTPLQSTMIKLHMSGWSNDEDLDSLTRQDLKWLKDPKHIRVLEAMCWADMMATFVDEK